MGSILYHVEHPGQYRPRLTRALDFGVRGVVIQGYHSGTAHACTQEEHPDCTENIIPFLERAREKKIPVFLIFGDFVGDSDNRYGYEPFDKGVAGDYVTSRLMARAGIVPLKVNVETDSQVLMRLEEVLAQTTDYDEIIGQMYWSFPFNASLEEIQASAR